MEGYKFRVCGNGGQHYYSIINDKYLTRFSVPLHPKPQNLLGEISKISTYVEGAADQVNCLAIKLTVSIAHREKLGLGLDAVAEESDAMEAYALKVLVEVSRQVELAGQRLMF